MLQFTGHPFVDVGLAAIAAYGGKNRIADLDAADLDRVAQYIEQNYVLPPLRGHLTMAFTSNAWFAQDAFNPDKPGLSADQCAERKSKRDQWAARHLRQWATSGATAGAESTPPHQEGATAGAEGDDPAGATRSVCVFTGLPAAALELSNKLAPGRIGRAQMPLLQGDEAINFFTGGVPGLPIAPEALLALQFMPMACARVGVGLLAVHADSERLTLDFARSFLNKNVRDVTSLQAAGEDKFPSAPRALKTLLVEELLQIERHRRNEERRSDQAASITAYNFNNGKDPKLEIYHLPLQITRFLQRVNTPAYLPIWEQIVERAWQRVAVRSGKKGAPAAEQTPRFNYLFEDLFTLPQEATRFVRLYFLRVPRRAPSEEDPRRDYSPYRERDLVSWPLVELFMKEVMSMDDAYIEQIRILGDKLADYTRRQGGKRFFRQFFTEQKTYNFLNLLTKTNIDYVRFTQGRDVLFDLEGYLAVFMDGTELMRPDWRLARDLVLIRMVEQLKDWIAANPDTLPEEDVQSDQAAEAVPVE